MLCQGPDHQPRTPILKAPVGTTDSHCHIFGPSNVYHCLEEAEYSAPDALPAAYRNIAGTLGIMRTVLVQPSIYGTDNRCMLEAAAKLEIPVRMIVVVPFETTDAEMAKMHEAGVRGIRFILAHTGGLHLTDLERFSSRIKEMGWHIQLLLRSNHLLELESRLSRLSTDFVIDHLGFVQCSESLKQPAFSALLRLIRSGRCWVKLTAGYRYSNEAPPYRDVIPFVQALCAERPDRLIWGSDWPHAAYRGNMPNTTELFDLLLDWIPDEQMRKQILADNPSALFGFSD